MISSQDLDALRHLYDHSEASDSAQCGACRVTAALVLEGHEAKLQRLKLRDLEAAARAASARSCDKRLNLIDFLKLNPNRADPDLLTQSSVG